jgi:Holliday junction resolvase-like predicted endonuclease
VNTARKGNAKENLTARWLEADGWLTGSRRHIGGAADLVAVKPGERPRLIEVKATKGGPYERFVPADRALMREEAKKYGAVAELAWWPPGAKEPTIIDEAEWP